MEVDWLIVGAGFTGSVLAERLATQLDQKVLVVEQRAHIGGNAYDYYDDHGVLIHRYGPHIFHTNADYVWDYLAQFTPWRSYYHRVLAAIDGQFIPVPFNLKGLYALFPPRYADELAQQLIQQYGFDVKIPILKIRETAHSDEVKFLAEFIYQKIFHHYTVKQWGLTPEQLHPSVTARVPLYISYDDRYFQDKFQGLPQYGYSRLFEQLLAQRNIKLLLNTAYQEVAQEIKYKQMIFTGPIDEFFNYQYGELPYRSLDFHHFHTQQPQLQPVATVNYPNDYTYTRITEFKHLTGQNVAGSSYIKEYPQAFVRGQNVAYYPIPQDQCRARYHQYAQQTEQLKGKVLFAGRLADYQYYNMDQAVARALTVFHKVICAQS